MSLEELESFQLKRLKILLTHARRHSSYYADTLSKVDIASFELSDLSSLPILSKKDLYANVNQIFNNPHGKNQIISETSGSTGDPLVFNRSDQADAYTRAAQYRGYSWFGINPWDRNVYFWGFNPSWKQKLKIRALDFLMNRYRIFSFNESELAKAKKYLNKCTYVEGYSSAIFTLSQSLERDKQQYNKIRMVKGTSEKIFDYYQETVKQVFNQKMISEYGAAETGIIAFECPMGSMHIAMENVIVEVIDEKIIVTNLHSDMFPIIRYELGDYVKLDPNKKCPCGRAHTIIDDVTGRVGLQIYGKKSTYPSFTLYYIFKNIALTRGISLAYFGIQNEKGSLIIQIVKPKYNVGELTGYIHIECDKYFKNDIHIDVQFINGVDGRDKKTKDFISFVK